MDGCGFPIVSWIFHHAVFLEIEVFAFILNRIHDGQPRPRVYQAL